MVVIAVTRMEDQIIICDGCWLFLVEDYNFCKILLPRGHCLMNLSSHPSVVFSRISELNSL